MHFNYHRNQIHQVNTVQANSHLILGKFMPPYLVIFEYKVYLCVIYSTLYVKAAKKSVNCRYHPQDDGSTFIWPVGREKQVSNTAVVL